MKGGDGKRIDCIMRGDGSFLFERRRVAYVRSGCQILSYFLLFVLSVPEELKVRITVLE